MKTALTLAALALLVVAAPNAVAADQPQGYTFITDTLGGNGIQSAAPRDVLAAVKRTSPNQVGLAWQYLRDTGQITTPNPTAPDIRETDPRAPGSVSEPKGFTFITDTLGGDGGAPLPADATVPDASFSWTDAAVGAATAAGSILLLLSGTFVAIRRRRRLAL
jgi:hypothetical protein